MFAAQNSEKVNPQDMFFYRYVSHAFLWLNLCYFISSSAVRNVLIFECIFRFFSQSRPEKQKKFEDAADNSDEEDFGEEDDNVKKVNDEFSTDLDDDEILEALRADQEFKTLGIDTEMETEDAEAEDDDDDDFAK